MHVTLVYVQVKPECIADFVAVTKDNHLQSIQELGNLRFDVIQQADDSTRFVLYEAYADAVAAAAHKQTAHYLTWRDTVAGWMASPRQGVLHHGLFLENPCP